MQIALNEVPRQLALAYVAGANVWMWGKPALAKTAIAEEFVRIMKRKIEGFKAWYLYVPVCGPTDIQAAMPNVESGMLEFFSNGTLPNAYTDPDAQGVLHLGELANGDPTTVKLLQKYVNNEDMNGKLRKPAGVMVLADSNRIQDKSGSIQQMRAFLSRFTHLDVFSTPQIDIEYAAKANWHITVQTFMKENPDLIDNYDEVFAPDAPPGVSDAKRTEEGKRGIWANKRGLERLSKLEEAAEEMGTDINDAMIYGTLGSGVGAQYIIQREVTKRLASVETICANPAKHPIPSSPSERYAQSLLLALKCDPDQLKDVHTYVARMPEDIQTVVIHRLTRRSEMAKNPVYLKWLSQQNLTDVLTDK